MVKSVGGGRGAYQGIDGDVPMQLLKRMMSGSQNQAERVGHEISQQNAVEKTEAKDCETCSR